MLKKEIIPAILEKNISGIEKKISKLRKNKLKNIFIQIDICDGELTPEKTFASSGNIPSFFKIKKITENFFLELDVIVNLKKNTKKQEKFFSSIKKTCARRVVFHNKGVGDWGKIFDIFSITECEKKIDIGVAIWLSEKNEDIEKILKKYPFKYLQIMGIEKVGYGGQKISDKVFEKVKYFSKKFPNLPIQVDGGVKIENSKKLEKNGVSRFVSGSGIFGVMDINGRIGEF